MRSCWLALLLFFLSQPIYAQATFSEPVNLQQCLSIALEQSASVNEAEAKIDLHRAKLSEVQSNYYPKLSVLGYLAPMFTVNGNAFTQDVDREFDLGSWGPSTHLEALLAMPIYTFGRLESGEYAAKERLAVEKARLREAQNHVKLEVKKFYYTYLYAKTMLPHLKKAEGFVAETLVEAKKLYDASTGKVTKVDLQKLKFAEAEVKKYILQSEEGISLAMSALKHTMGLEENATLELIESKIPKPVADWQTKNMAELLSFAKENRPEWQQIHHGLKAATAFRQSETKSKLPILFVAGTIEHSWAPTRDDSKNPYHYDPYNELFGGVAVGVKWDLDWYLTKAKVQAANATLKEVTALKQLAVTGIPLQVKKSLSESQRFYKQVKLSRKAQKAASKWIAFAGTAYSSGTGEVKDVLEGMVAMLTAKRDYYENMLNFHVAKAELDYAIGQ